MLQKVYFSWQNLLCVLSTNAYRAFFTKKLVESTISESKPCIIHFVFLTMYFRLCRPVYFSLVNLNDVFYTRLVYVFFTNLFMFFCIFYQWYWTMHFTLVLKMANTVFYTRFLGKIFSLHFTLDQDPKQCILY